MNLKKFKEFRLNELKYTTYLSAADKLRKLGGKHSIRANRLKRHALMCSELGQFNLNADIIGSIEGNVFLEHPSKPKLRESVIISKKESPVPIYFTRGLIINPIVNYYEDEITDCESISITFFCIPEDERFDIKEALFMLCVPIEWEFNGESPIFKIDDSPVFFSELSNGVLKFADRKSALKFKRLISDQNLLKRYINGFDEIREFFMEYSDATEWDRFFDKLKSISVNQFYD